MSSHKSLRLQSDGLEVRYSQPDASFAAETLLHLQAARASLLAYFSLGPSLPDVRAFLAPDRATFDELVADVLTVQIERPSDPRRIAQPQRNDIVLLAPSAYASESTYDYVPDDYRRMTHHELTHVVQEHLSPDIETSPFWWDEGLAVYLSGQWRHESQFRFREPVLDCRHEGDIPSLREIREDASLAYAFGWTVVRFLECKRGAAVIALVVNRMRDGDVWATLGENERDVEVRWQSWLLNDPDSVNCNHRAGSR
jgi:hypothetical protein